MKISGIFKLIGVFIILFTLSAESQTLTQEKEKGALWSVLKSENFNVHFIDIDKQKAEYVAEQAEMVFAKSTNIIGYLPVSKFDIYINKALTEKDLDLYDNKLTHEILVKTPDDESINRLSFQFNYQLVLDMLGKQVYKRLPDWFVIGIADYITHEKVNQQEIESLYLQKLAKLSGEEAALTGSVIWNYIVQKYGEEKVADLINLSRILKDEKRGIQQTLGLSYEELIADVKQYYDLSS